MYMLRPNRVLILESRDRIAARLHAPLADAGYELTVEPAASRLNGESRSYVCDAIVLESTAAGRECPTLVRRIRESGWDVPIAVISQTSSDLDRVDAFRSGADAYLSTPVSTAEFLARIGALLRRASMTKPSPGSPLATVSRFGEIELDVTSRTVKRDGRSTPLTSKQFDLLVALARREGRVVTRAELLRDVWGDRPGVRLRIVDITIVEVRRKVEVDPSNPRHLVTVAKAGYRFDVR
jgi:DNA-binding response OmpR family regulator